MTSQVQTIDFVIDLSGLSLVQNNLKRIQTLFDVKVHFSHVSESFPKSETKQWIEITGQENNRNNAKDYILAIVSPQNKITVQKIRNSPLYTSSSKDQIEKESCAVLVDCDEHGLTIEGSDIAVGKALSMIDEMFHGININDCEQAETDRDHDWVWVDKDEVENGITSQNKNNSSLTPVTVLDSTSIHNSDSFKTAHNTMSKGQGTKGETNSLNKTTQGDIEHDGFTVSTNNLPTAWSFSRQGPTPSSSQTRNYFSYASPSAISPDQQPMIVNPTVHTAQTSLHNTITHRGDGHLKTLRQFGSENQLGGGRQLPDRNATTLSTYETEQAENLTALARQLHYKEEDIQIALSKYSMKDVVVPADFLETVKVVKAAKHLGGQHFNYWSVPQPPASQVKQFSVDGGHATDVIVISDEEMEEDTPVEVPQKQDKRIASTFGSGQASGSHSTLTTASEYSQRLAASSQTRPAQVKQKDTGEGGKSLTLQVQSYAHATQQTKQANALDQRKENLKPTVMEGLVENVSIADSLDTSGSDYEISRHTKSFRKDLRYIVIDGSNVAMLHGDNKEFSVYGLEICINYFRRRGHDRITAFVPESRRYSENRAPIRGRRLLEKLNDDGYVKFTPARRVNGKTIASYDDRYILSLAEKEDGIVVSNDQFRDLCLENPSYRNIVERRLLQFMFVNNHFMPPDDPLGRYGPHLDQFLRTSIPPAAAAIRNGETKQNEETEVKQLDLARPNGPFGMLKIDQKPGRSQQLTQKLFEQLIAVFPDPNQSLRIYSVLQNHSQETDINRLTNYVLSFLSD